MVLYFGGGLLMLMKFDDICCIGVLFCLVFNFVFDVEISVEMDLNDMDEVCYDVLVDIGMMWVSFGVQDFQLEVQKVINWIQIFEYIKLVVDVVWVWGVYLVNCDFFYGLLYQMLEMLVEIVRQILMFDLDCIVLFGYVYVLWMKKYQMMIKEEVLLDVDQCFDQL